MVKNVCLVNHFLIELKRCFDKLLEWCPSVAYGNGWAACIPHMINKIIITIIAFARKMKHFHNVLEFLNKNPQLLLLFMISFSSLDIFSKITLQ